jgi:hypothetical protein
VRILLSSQRDSCISDVRGYSLCPFLEGYVRNFLTLMKLELTWSKKSGKRKPDLSASLSIKNHTRYALEPNSVLRREKPETNHMKVILTFICLRATTLSYDVAHRTVRS